jgi:thiol-disulfide isomerase/thioredoxin
LVVSTPGSSTSISPDGGSSAGESKMAKIRPVRLTLVEASWCPHCVPLSTERAPGLAKRLGVPLRLLDIDVPPEEAEADRLVHDHGRWDDDYVIPQLFLEWSDGTAEAILIADRGSPTSVTRGMWEKLLEDPGRLLAHAAP